MSKKLNYAVLYVDQIEIDEIEQKLMKLSFVLKIERSLKPLIRTDYESTIPDKEKQYDYNMGV